MNPAIHESPYGSWQSPISAAQIAAGSVRLSGAAFAAGKVTCCESRPDEGGRNVIVCLDEAGVKTDVVPAGFNVRTRVHEYGGGAYCACGDRFVFCNDSDQQLYAVGIGEAPRQITDQPGLRFANLQFDGRRSRVLAVCEDHRGEGEPVNSIVGVPCSRSDKPPQTLVSGCDFYAAPRLSPDGTKLAWVAWNHPNMPWDAAELWRGDVDDAGRMANAVRIAGGTDEAIVQPEWSPDGTLHFVSDRTDWWNLYRYEDGAVQPVCELAAEFALPHWVFGRPLYGFTPSGRLLAAYTRDGMFELGEVDRKTGAISAIDMPCNTIDSVCVGTDDVLFIGGSPSVSAAVMHLDLRTGECRERHRADAVSFPETCLSTAAPVEFPTGNGRTAHALFYAPRNDAFRAPADELPPLVVMVHGGPTAAASAALNLKVQYLTSRGIAVLDVNYGGSTGYGRRYRERLNGQWGVVDVDDCCNGAAYLAERGLVDPGRMAIAGGSAGGYTTLAALTMRNVFAAGISRYGISDCEVLAQETHKFEARYLDRLIGPYPEARDVYLDRSPIHHVDGLSCPVIFLQGSEDEVVPPNQAQMMVEALRRKGLPVAYLEFEGEQHGFRQARTIRRALEAELYFLSRAFGFDLASPVEPVPIENL